MGEIVRNSDFKQDQSLRTWMLAPRDMEWIGNRPRETTSRCGFKKQIGNDLKPVRPTCKSSSSVGFALSCFAAWAAASKFWDGMAKMGRGVAAPSDGVERIGNLVNVDSYGSLDGGGES